jgi:hypothetical protein
MKRFLQLLANLSQGLVGKLLVVANFIICLLAFDWHKFFRYLETPAKLNCHLKLPGRAIDFCGFGGLDLILFFFAIIYLIFVYPSIAMTEIVLEMLKKINPLWCLETFDMLYIPIFAVFNTFYWFFLGDLIEMWHSAYLRRKPMYQKPLNIFPDSD